MFTASHQFRRLLAIAFLTLAAAGMAKAETVDYLVLYDSHSASYFDNQPETAIRNWVDQVNSFYANSDMNIELRIVGMLAHEANGSSMGDVLGNIRQNSWVQQKRDELGADFVTQLHETGSCGVAYMAVHSEWAYSVVGPNCGSKVMAHELGHNMGLAHSRLQGDQGGARFDYALGHGENGVFATIMTYQWLFSAPKVPNFSNPRINCNGLPCGVPEDQSGEADAAKAVNNVGQEMADFRPTQVTGGGDDDDGGSDDGNDGDDGGNGGSENWTYCADENGYCQFSGTREVRYGAEGEFTKQVFTDGVSCDNRTFGDPNPGVYKACWYGEADSGGDDDADPVTVYQHYSYNGYSASLSVGEYTLSDLQSLGIRNNDLSSARVPEGVVLELYDYDNFRGTKTVYDEDNAGFPHPRINDTTTSIIVRSAGDSDGGDTGNALEEGTYTVRAQHSGKCLDVYGASGRNGANLIQWNCHNNDNQRWIFERNSNDSYRIRAKHSGKCMSVANNGTANGANIHQWRCEGRASQQWKVSRNDDGSYFITASHSGKVADVRTGTTQNGASIHQWEKHGRGNQRFLLNRIE